MSRRRTGSWMTQAAPINIEVLAQRQANTDHAVQQLQTQFSSSFGKLESQIQQIADRMTAQQRPQWQLLATILVTLLTIIGVGWGLGTRPITADIGRQSEDIKDIGAAVGKLGDSIAVLPQTYVSRQEYTDTRIIARQDNENRLKGLGDEIDQVVARVETIRDAIVPRGEHEERWRSQEAAIANVQEQADKAASGLQRQIDEVKESLGGIYGARDVIRDLQARLDRIEQRGAPQ